MTIEFGMNINDFTKQLKNFEIVNCLDFENSVIVYVPAWNEEGEYEEFQFIEDELMFW